MSIFKYKSLKILYCLYLIQQPRSEIAIGQVHSSIVFFVDVTQKSTRVLDNKERAMHIHNQTRMTVFKEISLLDQQYSQ